MACALCNTRREKRHCPGVRGKSARSAAAPSARKQSTVRWTASICTRAYTGRPGEKDPAGLPNRDFRVTQEFLVKNIEFVTAVQLAILGTAMGNNAIDNDVKEALDGLVRTYRTLGSGLYYESRPVNPIAAAMFDVYSSA